MINDVARDREGERGREGGRANILGKITGSLVGEATFECYVTIEFDSSFNEARRKIPFPLLSERIE
jgi:hypothetical protein